MSLNRKTFDKLLGADAPNSFFKRVCELSNGNAVFGYDVLHHEFYELKSSTPDKWIPDPPAKPCLKIIIRGLHQKSDANVRVLSIPFWILENTPVDHWVYRITFSPASDAASELLSHGSFDPFRIKSGGYVGMTSRPNPFTRFDEHYQKVMNGTGHLLHKAWRAISTQTEIMTQFSICGNAHTREKAFDLEEQLVDELGTIAPGGLNVIAGGMKGIREMWRLGLMSKGEKPTDANRERALVIMESDRSPVSAHYRSGHIRKLPERCSHRSTWVSPCWVGMKVSENA